MKEIKEVPEEHEDDPRKDPLILAKLKDAIHKTLASEANKYVASQ